MNKEQFIATLQACYFGDKGAFNLILNEYEELHNKIDKVIKIMEDYTLFSLSAEKVMKIINILKDSDVDE